MHNFPVYSPEQALHLPLFSEKKVEVWVKRDDMIHPFISGNKWRKLKYTLQDALENNTEELVTFGGPWSNHLLATACAGALFDIATTAFVRGEEVDNPVLKMCQLYGMNLHFVNRTAYKDKNSLFQQYQQSNTNNTYFIDEGGSSILAAQGCAEIITELQNHYDHIICAAGTGATVAGLAKGLLSTGKFNTQLHVIPVLKRGEFIIDEMKKLNAPIENVHLHTNFHFGGYAKTKPELIDFIKTFVAQSGIMIEPTYTGKTMYALHALIQTNQIRAQQRVLFIHTGGLTGLLGQLNLF